MLTLVSLCTAFEWGLGLGALAETAEAGSQGVRNSLACWPFEIPLEPLVGQLRICQEKWADPIDAAQLKLISWESSREDHQRINGLGFTIVAEN